MRARAGDPDCFPIQRPAARRRSRFTAERWPRSGSTRSRPPRPSESCGAARAMTGPAVGERARSVAACRSASWPWLRRGRAAQSRQGPTAIAAPDAGADPSRRGGCPTTAAAGGETCPETAFGTAVAGARKPESGHELEKSAARRGCAARTSMIVPSLVGSAWRSPAWRARPERARRKSRSPAGNRGPAAAPTMPLWQPRPVVPLGCFYATG